MNTIKKIVFIGGESTGKSTLCEQLANHFNTKWVPEFAREYLGKIGINYNYSDLKNIAMGQVNSEDSLIQYSNKILFCDTDLHVIQVWSEYKYGKVDLWILNQIAERKYDAYIITSPDFEWEDDPLRENPNPSDRQYFFKLYIYLVIESGLPFCVVKGTKEERLNKAIAFCNQLVS